jgi:hypothetical protein
MEFMMGMRKFWLIAIIFLMLLFVCAVLFSSFSWIITSFPEILLGQVVLASETKPLSPRAYQSAEFLLNQVDLSEIEQAVYIALQEDVLFWDPDYVGFPRTELNDAEIRLIQQLLSNGSLFYQTPDGSSHQCVTLSASQGPKLETCSQGKGYMDRFVDLKWDAEQSHAVGLLHLTLSSGRLVEIRIYPSDQGLAYTPYEKSGDWWINGVAKSSSLIDEFSARAAIPPILVLWPEIRAAQANARAARIIGNKYESALSAIQNSAAVREVFGGIQEIRPAAGINYYSAWMDTASVLLTFRVIGARGEGAVIVQGYDCFDLQMVFEGTPVDDGSSFICQ